MNDDICHGRIIHSDRIETAKNTALAPAEIDHLAHIFKAMADPTRLNLLWAMKSDEICVCDLAALVGISESAVSHQLRLLRTMGLVTNRRQGPVLYYRLADEHVSSLIDLALEHVRE